MTKLLKKKKYTCAQLGEIILQQQRTLGEQGRAEMSEQEKYLDKLRDLNRAAMTLARYRLLRDRMLPKHPEEAIDSRVRANTYPRALADVLAELLAAADDIGAAVEEAAATDEEAAEYDVDRERMLRALEIDEWEWEHRMKWRY